MGRLSPVNPTPGVSFVYDPYFPRVVSMSDGVGLTQYAYGDIGHVGALQVKTETTPLASGIITYGYDQLGRLSSRVVSGSAAETFGYDAIGRLTSHANDLGAFTLAWLGQTGQIASRQLAASSLATTWNYLPNSGDRRLAGVATAGLSAGQSTAFALTSNAGGFITGQVETSDAALAYPPQVAAMNAAFNTLNQMATLNTQALTWDANGNLLSDGTHTYSWDAENRLVAIAYAGQPTQSTTFAYDGLGRRVTITSTPVGGSAVATSYIWCGARPCQARNAANAVTRAYYAEGEFSPGSPGVSAYYGPDQIGSARRVFTAASAPVYDYDPYGAPLQTTAPATDYGWAGMLDQADAGLYLTPARAYSPVLGRWLSRDPVGEGTDPDGNLYVYVGGEPVYRVDPGGLWQITIQGGFGLAGRFTFGNNGGSDSFNGQWNYGGYVGAGEGLSIDLDIVNRGCKEPGVNYGFEGAGQIGFGPHLTVEAHALGREPRINVVLGVPGSPVGASFGTEGVTVPTIGFGESAVVGLGGTRFQ